MLQNLERTFKGKKVFITGHTGFKGSWLTIWLQQLGAQVIGYSLPPPTSPSLFEIAGLENSITHIISDIRDYSKLYAAITRYAPDAVFHLAAQSLVLTSYDQPKATFDINCGGTVNLLEACRHQSSIQAILVITTDKCYDNQEWVWGYRERDPLGGSDPYSASKAMAELAAASYRSSFFRAGAPVATARAGNVIGGGDFSDNRLMPDTMKSLLQGHPVKIRNPDSVRPWTYVLDPLYGYLLLADRLLSHGHQYAEAWNFGPLETRAVNAKMIVEKSIEEWGNGDWVDDRGKDIKPEMNVLRLNWEKAANRLGWVPAYDWEQAVKETVRWYSKFQTYLKNSKQMNMLNVCLEQIERYNMSRNNRHEVHSDTPERVISR